LTAQRVADHLTALKPRRIDRHVLPNLGAVNFVLHGALSGGVTRSLALDAHGKTLGANCWIWRWAMRKAFLLGGALLALATGRRARHRDPYRQPHPAPVKPGERPYEIITGTFDGDLSPAQDAIITDIAHAPRNGKGRVGYSATFAIARPLERGSGVLFYDVPNRGNGKVGPDEDGHIRVISGWQGDLTRRPACRPPPCPSPKG
jgi:hypothetical protein